MDKEKLKLIIRNLELLIDSLKVEIYSDVSAYSISAESKLIQKPVLDYDEIFDDDGYPD